MIFSRFESRATKATSQLPELTSSTRSLGDLYPYRERLTVIGRAAEEADWFSEEFPGARFVEADLRAIPLPDGYFENGICNAVVEHAGTRDQQTALVAEVCRVCRNVLFTTPNRRFPVELHTFLPLLHWLPDGLYRAALRRLGFTYFAEIDNLNLLDGPSFVALFPVSRRNRLVKSGLQLLRSNLVCISRENTPRWAPAVAGARGHPPGDAPYGRTGPGFPASGRITPNGGPVSSCSR